MGLSPLIHLQLPQLFMTDPAFGAVTQTLTGAQRVELPAFGPLSGPTFKEWVFESSDSISLYGRQPMKPPCNNQEDNCWLPTIYMGNWDLEILKPPRLFETKRPSGLSISNTTRVPFSGTAPRAQGLLSVPQEFIRLPFPSSQMGSGPVGGAVGCQMKGN